MLAYGFFVRGIEEAVDLTVRVMKELHLAYAELVGLFVSCLLRDLVDRGLGQFPTSFRPDVMPRVSTPFAPPLRERAAADALQVTVVIHEQI
jgi:hypothetical protein